MTFACNNMKSEIILVFFLHVVVRSNSRFHFELEKKNAPKNSISFSLSGSYKITRNCSIYTFLHLILMLIFECFFVVYLEMEFGQQTTCFTLNNMKTFLILKMS